MQAPNQWGKNHPELAPKTFYNLSGAISYLDYTDNRNAMLILSDMELMRYHEKAVPDTVNTTESELSPAEL